MERSVKRQGLEGRVIKGQGVQARCQGARC